MPRQHHRRRLAAAHHAPSSRIHHHQLPSDATRGVYATDTALFATLHLAHLDGHGRVAMPPGIRRVLIEIGCSDRDTMDVDELVRYEKNSTRNDSFLIAFEPLLDKYATLLARANERFNGRGVTDRASPLGHHHRRGVVLPFAVAGVGTGGGTPDGMMSINVSRIAGCSSLVPFNEGNSQWGRQCFTPGGFWNGGTFESRLVPTITLEQALRLAPPDLPIDKLKLGARAS